MQVHNKDIIVETLLSKEVKDLLYDKVEDKQGDLLNSDPEEYGGKWDPNPFGVDAALIGSSGCYEYPQWGEDAAWDDAKEDIKELFLGGEISISDEVDALLEDYNNTDKEWLDGIITYVLNNL